MDTEAVGLVWDKTGRTRRAGFTKERHTVKVLSDTARIVTQMSGDTAGVPQQYTCKPTLPLGRIACDDGSGVEPWVFYRNTYTRAFLAGPPAGGTDENIWIAYGTCTVF